ncbi:lysylphosphatidylglycerol synthase transmembrane domain-containing protein [Aliiruegeria sabulilitoris]|uniref:lysylphosphatidylglycerol synthase transmembrane domain-containing protein n=1 Tax=Aliiruegeria sabulilitoris TaxID=1510458 RepID=UPI0009E8B76F|nr:lysylphosphatidylglycerol synthase transmembrane domain-containing protein [Aliiruegeria sabulilitoris]NDR55639.1 flippase-like domain-containing protein [Pseudoruegeria sp. M32A2M]
MRKRVLWIWIGQLVVAIVLMTLLWSQLDGAAAGRDLAGARPGWLFAALAALTLQTFLSALRWRFTAARLGQSLPLGRVLREYYLSQFANQVLPGGMLGDAGRAYRARNDGGLVISGQAVIFERFAGQVMLFVVMLAGLALAAFSSGGALPPDTARTLAGPASAVAAAGIVLLWLAPRLPGRVGRAFRNVRGALSLAFLGRRVFALQVVLSLGATVCNLTAFAFCTRATGTVLAPVHVLALVPLILYAMVVPLSISGWGLREGAAAALFPLAGATAAAGLAASTVFGLVFLASTLPGLVVLMSCLFLARVRRSSSSPSPSRLPNRNRPLS